MATNRKYEITEDAVTTPAEEQVGTETVATKADDITTAKIKSDMKLKQLQHNQKELAHEYTKQDKVSVSLAPFYAAYLGSVPRFAVNGISVYVPCDGRVYQIPETFAGEVARKKRAVDDMLRKQKRAGDIANNGEDFMGQLSL